MPAGKRWNPTLHKWIKRGEAKEFKYEEEDLESWSLLLSYFRYYPDRLLEICRSDDADYEQQFIQCLIWRIDARYKNTFVTGSRGTTKTFTKVSGAATELLLWPGEKIRYFGPTLDQTAEIVRGAYDQVSRVYPSLTSQIITRVSAKGDFALVTDTRSEFSIKTNRGDNSHQVICEECGQEDGIPFDHEKYQTVVSATNRLQHMVNGKPDPNHIDFKRHYITSASSQQNDSYRYRCEIYDEMVNTGTGFAIDIPYTVPVLSGIRDFEYYNDLKKNMTPEQWLRECESVYTGATKDPVVSDTALVKSQVIYVMEDKHCGDPNCIYIIGYDVSHEEGANHAMCATAVLKLTKQDDPYKQDLFMKELVYVCDMKPQTSAKQAQYLKNMWKKYTSEKSNFPTYIAIDNRQYGKAVTEQLMKDVNDGMNICCYNHEYIELEVPGSMPIIYPVKASNAARETGKGDPDGEMIKYAKAQFEGGDVHILTPDHYTGVDAYKKAHRIRSSNSDKTIAIPYIKAREMSYQISNLRILYRGNNWAEGRKNVRIQRDMWSALKYALRLAQILESENLVKSVKKNSKNIDTYLKKALEMQQKMNVSCRSRVIGRRGRIT